MHFSSENLKNNNLEAKVQQERNEEYYFQQCSLEMASILMKFVAEIMLMFGACQEFEQLPEMFSNLLEQVNEKTDGYIE